MIRSSPEYRMKTETLRKIITEPEDFVPGLNPLRAREAKGTGKKGTVKGSSRQGGYLV